MGASFSAINDVDHYSNASITNSGKIRMLIFALICFLIFSFFSVKIVFFSQCPTCDKRLTPQWFKTNSWEKLDSIGGPTELEFAKGYAIVWKCRYCEIKYGFKKCKFHPLGE